METNHIFNNISEALDYVLVEEAIELQENEYRRSLLTHMSTAYQNGMAQPFPFDYLGYSASGFYNLASNDKYIMTRLQSKRYCFKPNLRNRMYLFRGQSKYYSPCASGLFRDKTKNYYIGESVMFQEMSLLILSHPLAQLWDTGIDLLGKHFRFEMNIFGLSQHYYNKTIFLDLTSDPEVAAFFATTKYDWATDTYSPILDNTQNGVLYCYALIPRISFKLGPDDHYLSTIGYQIFPRSEKQRGFLVTVPKGADFNEYPEVSVIRFKHNADTSKFYFDKYHGGKDLFPDDILMKHWKRENKDKKQISEQTLLFNHICNQDKSVAQLRKELEEEGFIIKKYQPVFTEEELDEYYAVAHEQWQTFCDNIFIPGDSNGKLKDALRRVPEIDEYRWAFNKSVSHNLNYKDGYLLKEYEPCLKLES